MTTWLNIGLYADDTNTLLRELFDSKWGDSLIDDSPPTIRTASLGEREQKDFAKSLLSTFTDVTTVVMIQNSDTADWATGYIYTVPDDLRDITCETITGESGLRGSDVEKELRERGYSVTKSHITYELTPSEYTHLWRTA